MTNNFNCTTIYLVITTDVHSFVFNAHSLNIQATTTLFNIVDFMYTLGISNDISMRIDDIRINNYGSELIDYHLIVNTEDDRYKYVNCSFYHIDTHNIVLIGDKLVDISQERAQTLLSSKSPIENKVEKNRVKCKVSRELQEKERVQKLPTWLKRFHELG